MLIWAWLAATVFPISPAEAGCPAPLDGATRLVLVTTPTMNGPAATLETFERDVASGPWQVRTGPQPAVVGEAGLGWGLTFRHVAKAGEPIKQEGDRRAPAGIFPLGPAFGFSVSALPGYIQIEEGIQFCVDDPTSPHYSQIVTREQAGEGVSGEDMGAISLYRRGLVVDYATSGKAKSGSCIFIHIWREPGHGTVGCVAVPEATVADLQTWAGSGGAAIAILPEGAKGRFACLP
jgi:L,D-peptidoglycan transpeptidase YkuD (ErfK/YbiS/YcfS/YnhG family)